MINPRAYLRSVKNVKKGLEVRTLIIDALSKKELSVDELSKMSGMSKPKARYHLRNMLADGVVRKHRVGRRVVWRLTGVGQASLEETLG
ncbi:MAG: winged helix-turn-helix domain-containing protein [Candidatus Caldarchaeum sp.]|uniref:ArsR family transcriptional regulator n=1 Tax=Caldiarchaeum subterraneum TaxID=311458 RepID=A0A7C5L6V4_CALS0